MLHIDFKKKDKKKRTHKKNDQKVLKIPFFINKILCISFEIWYINERKKNIAEQEGICQK